MQVVIDGAYKAPREVNFWFGLILLQLVLGLSLTGYLLPGIRRVFGPRKLPPILLLSCPGLALICSV
jgi:ubiquinol-cytochrome c reductase cytochrome b subunit